MARAPSGTGPACGQNGRTAADVTRLIACLAAALSARAALVSSAAPCIIDAADIAHLGFGNQLEVVLSNWLLALAYKGRRLAVRSPLVRSAIELPAHIPSTCNLSSDVAVRKPHDLNLSALASSDHLETDLLTARVRPTELAEPALLPILRALRLPKRASSSALLLAAAAHALHPRPPTALAEAATEMSARAARACGGLAPSIVVQVRTFRDGASTDAERPCFLHAGLPHIISLVRRITDELAASQCVLVLSDSPRMANATAVLLRSTSSTFAIRATSEHDPDVRPASWAGDALHTRNFGAKSSTRTGDPPRGPHTSLAAWWLLSRARYRIFSGMSSYAKTAVYAGGLGELDAMLLPDVTNETAHNLPRAGCTCTRQLECLATRSVFKFRAKPKLPASLCACAVPLRGMPPPGTYHVVAASTVLQRGVNNELS